MTSEGAERIFERSIENSQLRYTELYADGDSRQRIFIQQMDLKFKKTKNALDTSKKELELLCES